MIYPVGFVDGYAPDTVWHTFEPVDELWIQFYVKLSANWKWHPIVQKVVYFRCGYLDEGGTNHMLGFVYDGPIDLEREIWEVRAIGFSLQHGELPEPLLAWGGDPDLVTLDTWHKVVMHVKINTPGIEDGIGQIWLNGELMVDKSDMLWGTASNPGGFHTFQFDPIPGGGPMLEHKEETYMYFDDFIMQDRPFQ
jgi:hypothetical protein